MLPVEISWLIFFCGFRNGNGKFADITAGSLSRPRGSSLDFELRGYAAHARAPTRSCSHAKSSTVFVIIHSSGIGRANGEITSKYPQG